jgi:hypothetical protein
MRPQKFCLDRLQNFVYCFHLAPTEAFMLAQLLHLLSNLRLSLYFSLGTILLSMAGFVFLAGQHTSERSIAVTLESPFAMRLEMNGQTVDFPRLTLMRDPALLSPSEGRLPFSLREIRSDFDIVPIGQILARTPPPRRPWFFLGSSSGLQADTPTDFDWNSHQNDLNFREVFSDARTVHRYYSDGCILEYKVDDRRHSIPSSFRWPKRTH